MPEKKTTKKKAPAVKVSKKAERVAAFRNQGGSCSLCTKAVDPLDPWSTIPENPSSKSRSMVCGPCKSLVGNRDLVSAEKHLSARVIEAKALLAHLEESELVK